MGPITGVAWVGPLLDRGGYGNVARGFVFGLDDIGTPVRAVPIGPRHQEIPAAVAGRVGRLNSTDLGARPMLVIHATPDAIWRLRWQGFSRTACNTIFETDRIPTGWIRPLRTVDEVWVPSRFNEGTFGASGVEASRIHRFPYGLDTRYWSPETREALRSLLPDDRPFRFLYCFAFGWRKGFDLLLRAYRDAFTARDRVELVIKVYGNARARQQITRIFEEDLSRPKSSLPRLAILDQPVSAEELRALYASADCYVSTDRANGWGMPAMESMSMGIPCATIDWSGSTEFMTEKTALLIPPEDTMVPVHLSLSQALPHQYKGHAWPDVRVESVRDILLKAFSMRAEERKSLGNRASADIQCRFSLQAAAERVSDHIKRINVAEATAPVEIRERPLDLRSLIHIYGTRPVVRRLAGDIMSRVRRAG